MSILAHFVEKDSEPRSSLFSKFSLSGILTGVLIIVAVAGVELLHVVPCVVGVFSFYLLQELQSLGGFKKFSKLSRDDFVDRVFRLLFESTPVPERNAAHGLPSDSEIFVVTKGSDFCD